MKEILCIVIAIFLMQPIPAQDIYTAVSEGNLAEVAEMIKKNPDLLNKQNPPGQTPLWKAAETGQLEITRFLLKMGADPEIGDNENTLPFHIAAKNGNIELFDLLHSHGFDINVRDDGGVTPLFYAVEGRNPEMVKHVISKGGDVKIKTNRDWPIMLYGAIFGPVETVQILLDNKADANAKNENGFAPIHSASSFGRTEIVKLLVEKGADVNVTTNDGVTPIMLSRNPNCYDVVEYLITKGADVNHTGDQGQTALLMVAARGTISLAELLLENGADINHANEFGQTALTSCAWSRNPDGMSKFLIMHGAEVNPEGSTTTTPLHRAARHSELPMVENLVNNGAQVNRIDEDGFTPLHYAITSRNDETAKYLVENGAFLNVGDKMLGDTELHMAAMMGSPDLVEFLVAQGSDITLKNKEGKTAFDLAWYYGHKDIAYFLLAEGTDDNNLAEYVTEPNPLTQSHQRGEAEVWFLGHSGWAIKTQNNLLIFDYFINPRMEAPLDSCLASGYIKPEELKDMHVTVFCSHSHGDHYSKDIFSWKETIPDIEYVMCFRPVDTEEEYTYIPIHEERTVNEMTISTIQSTDLDGAFLVEVDGLVIFHAGDHANGEDDLMKTFTDEVDIIAENNIPVDIMFAPIRGCGLGLPAQVEKGIEYMIGKIQPKLFVPMHAGEYTVAYKKFADDIASKTYPTKTKWVVAKGDHFTYENRDIASK
jgi:ankyrin repeat protein